MSKFQKFSDMEININTSLFEKLRNAKINQLSNNNVHIWKIDLCKMQNNINKYTDLLTQDEKNRANKYRITHKQESYRITRATLKLLLQYYVDKAPYPIALYKNNYGKPYIKGNALYFNVSHTDGMSIISFSKSNEIGIDLEHIKCDNNIINISKKYFTKRERFWIENLPKSEQIEGFLHCWVRKEAYIKALDVGLNLPLDSFNVISNTNQEILNNCFQINNWFVHSLDISTQHRGAICIQSPKVDVHYFDTYKFE